MRPSPLPDARVWFCSLRAIEVPFSRNDPNAVFGNKRLLLYLNAFFSACEPWFFAKRPGRLVNDL